MDRQYGESNSHKDFVHMFEDMFDRKVLANLDLTGLDSLYGLEETGRQMHVL